MWREITEKDRQAFNSLATHPLQSFEWGEFRQKTGITVIREGLEKNGKLTQCFQMTLHTVPHTPWNIGYLPKGTMPTKELLNQLRKVGKKYKCIFIQLEPNVKAISNFKFQISNLGLRPAAHPLFTKYTFELDLTQSEEQLLKNMHPKTRYNLKVARKHGVEITEETSSDAFETYWQLLSETTKRQGFFAHTKTYHRMMFDILNNSSRERGESRSSRQARTINNNLQAHLFLARYKAPGTTQQIPLVAWVLFTIHDHLYYPYGASSNLYRNVMASQYMMWQAILFGKKHHLKVFDMWGSLGENPDTTDPWYGFHRLKMGFGPQLVEFVGSYDLVISPILYQGFKLADKLRWLFLRLRK